MTTAKQHTTNDTQQTSNYTQQHQTQQPTPNKSSTQRQFTHSNKQQQPSTHNNRTPNYLQHTTNNTLHHTAITTITHVKLHTASVQRFACVCPFYIVSVCANGRLASGLWHRARKEKSYRSSRSHQHNQKGLDGSYYSTCVQWINSCTHTQPTLTTKSTPQNNEHQQQTITTTANINIKSISNKH